MRNQIKATLDRNFTTLQNAGSLRQYLKAHLNAATTGLENLMSSPIATLIIVLTLSISLCLPASGYLIIKNMRHAASTWDKGTTITLFLKQSIEPTERRALQAQILARPDVANLIYQSPEEALAEFKAANDVGRFVDSLPNNPLPGVFTLFPTPMAESPAYLRQLQADFNQQPWVDQAIIDAEWVEKLNAFLQLASATAGLLSVVIGAGLILVICNTVRLALERHRDEIEVLSLIGATQYFIRRPFLYRGLWYGGLGALLGLILIGFIQSALAMPAAKLSALYGNVIHLETMSFFDTITLLLASLSLGWLGAWFAVWHQWRTLAPESALKP